uniref:LysM and putative peptidoglycan-binding domain-containing protein 1 n=1 Tax=Monopterus albus TaxID=43700 RepID=A0A3Q3J3N0_MONAL|nr:lysM and putative peptidoglycan-binding domain-containing protein 1 [Monopterus albus]
MSMSGERAPLSAEGNNLLPGSRTTSYSSLVQSPVSALRQRCIEHKVQPGETLQGLALKYGVSMEQIKRANRLYTNDSIFLRKSLSIPVLTDLNDCSNGMDLAAEDSEKDNSCSTQNGDTESSSDNKQEDCKDRAADLTPVDYLKRLDDLISQSSQAAVRGCQKAESRVAALDAACTSRTSEWWPLTRSQVSSSRMQVAHRAIPLTVTRLTKKLRDREDEIFEL